MLLKINKNKINQRKNAVNLLFMSLIKNFILYSTTTEDGRSKTDFMYSPIKLQCFSVKKLGFFGNVYLLVVPKEIFCLYQGEKISQLNYEVNIARARI